MEGIVVTIFGFTVKMVNDDGNTDSCSECVFGKDKCPVFKGKNICQDSDGEYNKHFVQVDINSKLDRIIKQYRIVHIIGDVLCVMANSDSDRRAIWDFYDTKTGYKFYTNCETEDKGKEVIQELDDQCVEAVLGPKVPWVGESGELVPNKWENGVGVYITEW